MEEKADGKARNKSRSPTTKHQNNLIQELTGVEHTYVFAFKGLMPGAKLLQLVNTDRGDAHLAGTVYICGSCGNTGEVTDSH